MTKLAVYTEDKKFYPAVLEVLSNVVADFGIDDVEQWTHTTDRTVPTLVLGHPPEIKPINYITTLSQKQIMSNTAALTLLHAAVTNLLAPVTYPALSYTVLQQPLGMARHVKLGGVLVVDIETGGDFEVLLPQERELISVAINDGKNIYVYSRAALKREDVRTELRQILTSSRKLIAHNAKFDFRTLSEYCGVTIHGHLDTLTFLHALNPGLGNYGLKENCIRLLGATDWESGLKQYINKAKGLFYENIPEDILYKYNAYDVYWTWYLYLYLARAADGDPRIARLARFESRMVNFYQDVEAAGIAVDLDYLNKLDTDLKNEMVGPLAQLKAQVGDENFNPGSWQQVKKYLASIGVAVKSTDEKTLLKERVKMNEGGQLFVDTLLEYRGLVKEHGTYVKGILKRQRDGIVYPTFKVHGTNTGRLSSADPNVQNIPRDTERQSLRRIFVPRAENRKLVSVDYSQAELRVMACLSNDEYLISLFQDGMPDFFDSLMPSAFPRLDLATLPKDEKKNYRAKLKGVVYGLAYNRKAAAIAESLEMSQREAQAIINNFFQAAPQFYDWRMWVEEMALSEEDTLISPFGRYYQSEVVLGRNRQNIINAGLAFLPQSTASDFCVKAAIAVHEKLQGTDVKIVATIHDAILLDVPDADVQWVSDLTQAEMRASAYETFQAVPFATEATSGSSWEGI